MIALIAVRTNDRKKTLEEHVSLALAQRFVMIRAICEVSRSPS